MSFAAALQTAHRTAEVAMRDRAVFSVTTTGGGTLDAESGQTIGGTTVTTTLYSGPASVFGDRAMVVRDRGGNADIEGDAYVRLPEIPAALEAQKDDAEGVLTFGFGASRVVRACRITAVHRAELRLVVTWDGGPSAV